MILCPRLTPFKWSALSSGVRLSARHIRTYSVPSWIIWKSFWCRITGGLSQMSTENLQSPSCPKSMFPLWELVHFGCWSDHIITIQWSAIQSDHRSAYIMFPFHRSILLHMHRQEPGVSALGWLVLV